MLHRRGVLAGTLLLVAGCGGSNTGPQAPVIATVQDVQTGVVATGTRVRLNGVYVMAVAANHLRVWLSDGATASANTGVEAYWGNTPPNFIPAIGSRVDITGLVEESSHGTGGTLTEITSPMMTLLPDNPVAVTPVSNLNIAALIQDATAEPYEGVLVTLTNLKVTGTVVVTLTDGTTTITAGQIFANPALTAGTCYASVTGIWDYTVLIHTWQLEPLANGFVDGGTCS